MKLEKLEQGCYYHIYNRGINAGHIFKSDENKCYFLKLINKYLTNKVSILAYCLMGNHYHMAVQVIQEEQKVTQSFSNLFNAYAKAFNKMHNRTGSLFEKHFKRIRIQDTKYLRNLIIYINTNPELHGITEDYKSYKYSSYQTTISIQNSTDLVSIAKEEVINLFDDLGNFEYLHEQKRSLGLDKLNWGQ
ncbi:transposase [Arenibacter sp. M-2]|uniref:transposase n=1 Tax=unclassified Arenibacter TaxID=2615047 RepID=UPI000D755575|nr:MULTISPECIES: transposase [unclassified Arenibacter]MDL5513408.1 transposase [Arenibacter sp. M-2]PXX27726.1 transposase IS200 family protein [Arenibacter sp. ARW7G5Y1]